MTLKEFREATKDMPEDAEIEFCVHDNEFHFLRYQSPLSNVFYYEKANTIELC